MPASLTTPQPTQSIGASRMAEAAANQQLMLNFLASLKDLIALFTGALTNTTAYTGSSQSAGAAQVVSCTVTGARKGDLVLATTDGGPASGWAVSAYVSANDTVLAQLINGTGGTNTPASGNIQLVVLPATKFQATLTALAGGLASLVTT